VFQTGIPGLKAISDFNSAGIGVEFLCSLLQELRLKANDESGVFVLEFPSAGEKWWDYVNITVDGVPGMGYTTAAARHDRGRPNVDGDNRSSGAAEFHQPGFIRHQGHAHPVSRGGKENLASGNR
jgi:hypothetical protein